MTFFSNRFHIGDTVHTSIVDQRGAIQGEIVATSEVGVTIEFEQPHSGAKALRFIPWTSVSNIFKTV